MAVPTTEFTVNKTDIPGLLIIDVNLIGDSRGWFQEKFHQQKLVDAGFPADFTVVQQNVSFNEEVGVTRGIHAEPWNKYISVVSGEVFSAFVDLRAGENFGKVVTVTITPEKAVFLPVGCGNAFQTTEPNTYYSYLVDDHWTQEKYDHYLFVNANDPALNISWPTALDKAVLSDRDRNHPLLSEIKPMDT